MSHPASSWLASGLMIMLERDQNSCHRFNSSTLAFSRFSGESIAVASACQLKGSASSPAPSLMVINCFVLSTVFPVQALPFQNCQSTSDSTGTEMPFSMAIAPPKRRGVVTSYTASSGIPCWRASSTTFTPKSALRWNQLKPSLVAVILSGLMLCMRNMSSFKLSRCWSRQLPKATSSAWASAQVDSNTSVSPANQSEALNSPCRICIAPEARSSSCRKPSTPSWISDGVMRTHPSFINRASSSYAPLWAKYSQMEPSWTHTFAPAPSRPDKGIDSRASRDGVSHTTLYDFGNALSCFLVQAIKTDERIVVRTRSFDNRLLFFMIIFINW